MAEGATEATERPRPTRQGAGMSRVAKDWRPFGKHMRRYAIVLDVDVSAGDTPSLSDIATAVEALLTNNDLPTDPWKVIDVTVYCDVCADSLGGERGRTDCRCRL